MEVQWVKIANKVTFNMFEVIIWVLNIAESFLVLNLITTNLWGF
jgi:hypothetical protein